MSCSGRVRVQGLNPLYNLKFCFTRKRIPMQPNIAWPVFQQRIGKTCGKCALSLTSFSVDQCQEATVYLIQWSKTRKLKMGEYVPRVLYMWVIWVSSCLFQYLICHSLVYVIVLNNTSGFISTMWQVCLLVNNSVHISVMCKWDTFVVCFVVLLLQNPCCCLCCETGWSGTSFHWWDFLEKKSTSQLQTTHWPGEEGGQNGQNCKFQIPNLLHIVQETRDWDISPCHVVVACRTEHCSRHMWWHQDFSTGWESKSSTSFSRWDFKTDVNCCCGH